MAHRTITLRLSSEAYEMVKQRAADDGQSMNAWIESVLDVEDMRRRCQAHARYLEATPDAVAFSEAWADRNLDHLSRP